MRVFIVGATGVIGRTLVPQLVGQGDEVVALVRSRQRAALIDLPDVELIEGDLLTIEPSELTSILRGCDAAAHMATALRADSPGLGTTNTNEALRTTGTRKLIDAALEAGIGHYVQQGIALSYVDGGDDWLDESTPFFVADPAVTPPHVAMEAMVCEVAPNRMRWQILRGGSFVGPDTFQDRTIARLRSGEEHILGDGMNWVSYIHADDYADAVALALHSEASGGVLNINAEPIRQGEYLEALASRLGLPAPTRDPEATRPCSYRNATERARSVLGWQPFNSIWPE